MTGQGGFLPVPRPYPQPKPYPRPAPFRPRPYPREPLPRPRSMTVAVGILAPGAVVVAADSQETWGDLTTKETWKIDVGVLGSRETEGRILLAGAGGSKFLAYLKGEIVNSCAELRLGSGDPIQKVERVIRKETAAFFDAHFAPYANLETHRYGEPALVIAAQVGEKRALWSTYASTVQRHLAGAVAVGFGERWARDTLDISVNYMVSERAAVLAACYAVFAAKEFSGQYCGKDTQVWVLRRGFTPADGAKLALKEAKS